MSVEINRGLVDVGTGSTRSAMKVDWSRLPVSALRAYEARMTLGAETHGADNWKKGQPWRVVWNHMMEHMMQLRERLERANGVLPLRDDEPTEDDDLGAILWGAGAICWYEREAPEEIRKVFYGAVPK